MTTLKTVEINPTPPATSSVIWLHGLGADGYDFASIVPQLNLPPELAIHFVFPHAPLQPISIAQGETMRAWFDVSNLSGDISISEAGVRQSQQLIDELIAKEINSGIPSNRIFLAGFSQGAVMALQCGLRYPQPLAGILVLSGWLALAKTLAQEATAANQNTPILMLHGTMDTMIPINLAEKSYQHLKKTDFAVQWQTYPMEHTVCSEEIATIAEWLKALHK